MYNKMVTIATSTVIMNVATSTVYDNNRCHITLRKRKSSSWCIDDIVHPVEREDVTAVTCTATTSTSTTGTVITLPPTASSVMQQRQKQQQQQQHYIRIFYCKTMNYQTQCREIQLQQPPPLRIPTSTTTNINSSRSTGSTTVFPSFLRMMMVLLFLTTRSIYATPYNAVFQHGNMNSMNHDNHKIYDADQSQHHHHHQSSSYTLIRNHMSSLKDEEISYHYDNVNDDDIISTPNERELYSYDDTYYSDIHFYSNDDDYATSSGSNNYNSKYTSTTKTLPSNIDWTSYALKYVSCANIKTWKSTTDNGNNNYNDDSTTTENDILVQRTLVVVRLCPATLCSTYNVKGCNKDYGEYVLPASDYLQIIHTYYINQASIDKYCSVCSACMSYVTNPPTVSPTVSYNNNNNNGDDYYNRHARYLASNDDYFNDDAYGSSSYSKYKPWYLDDSYQCMYQNVCSKYMNKCKKYIENNNDDTGNGGSSSSSSTSATTATMTNTTFGQCIAFRGDGGSSTDYYYYYAAPHCAADGRTLHVGLYADSNCTIYVKSTGSSNPFASYTSGLSCLSCNYYDSSESSYALIPDTAIIMQSASSSSTTNESSLSILSTNHPLCSNLYNISAHCNTKLTPFTNTNNNSTMSLSNYTAGEDNVVCPYIESLEDNMYDAYGDVILLKSSMYGMFSPFWRKGNGVYGTEEEMQSMSTNSPKHRTVELCILILSMCIFCSLSIHAYTLRKKLLSRKFISWNTNTTENSSEKTLQQYPSMTNANYYTLFPWRYSTNKTNVTNTPVDASIHRTDSGVAMTRSYEAPNYSLGSYDSENFIIPTTNISHRPVYQPYGGTIPQRPTLGTTTAPAAAASPSVVRLQNHNDAGTIQNFPSLEYMDRNTGRFA